MTRATSEFERLYREHHHAVARCVASLGLPQATWPDIEQDVWITASTRMVELADHPRPRAWLCQVARYHAMHQIRGLARQSRKRVAVAAELPRCDVDPYRDHDAWDTLARLLAACPVEQREVYLKIELHGMSADEVADELGISVHTVSSRLRLTRRRLRDLSAMVAALLVTLRGELAQAAPPAAPRPAKAWSAVRSVAGRLAVVATVGLSGLPWLRQALAPEASPVVEVVVDDEPAEPGVVPQYVTIPERERAAVALPPPRHRDPAKRPAPVARPVPRPVAPEDDGQALLSRAQEALHDGRVRRALDLLAQHRRRYPVSELVVARETLHSQALCRDGQAREAREAVRELSREFSGDLAFRALLRRLPEECR